MVLGGAAAPAAGAGAVAAGGAASTNAVANDGKDILQFLDGALLHGELRSMDTNGGIEWRHGAARKPIRFQPSNLGWIRFESVKPIVAEEKPTCRFQFTNGDEVFGALTSLDTEQVGLQTWFGGDLKAPRTALHSLTFFPKGFAILYEGPNGPEGWKFDRGTRGWQYRDGGFVTSGVGILGRDLGLSGPCNFEFDLAWSGHFSLSFILYAELIDRFDYSQNCYMFHLAPGYLNAQRVQSGVGVTSLGQAQIPDMLRKGKLHLQIRTTKEDATLGVWADGVLVQKWRDHAGLMAKGKGIIFSSQMDGPQIRISNIKVTEWDGAFEPPAMAEGAPSDDQIFLANRDRVTGRLEGIRNGNLQMRALETALEVPLSRVTQVYLAQNGETNVVRKPWEIRVDVAGGGRFSFELDKWTRGTISGRSANFGLVALNSESIRQIQFNPGRPMVQPGTANSAAEKWEFEE